jgi:hypothetical protein
VLTLLTVGYRKKLRQPQQKKEAVGGNFFPGEMEREVKSFYFKWLNPLFRE